MRVSERFDSSLIEIYGNLFIEQERDRRDTLVQQASSRLALYYALAGIV